MAVVLIPWCWLFGQSLVTNRTLAFRDAAHFHYPSVYWTTQQWKHKQIPLWNGQENLGSPTMSDLSSSLFYPPKLVFQLPLPFPRLYNWFIAMHVLLAAFGTYRLARYWQVSSWSAMLAAVSFSLSGSLLSQHANVIYLVSAAWLPLALQSTDQMLVQRNWKSAFVLAAILALMTLGGDPQSAYHVGLLAGLYALILSRNPRNNGRHLAAARATWFQHRLVLLLLAGCLTFLLSAVQVLPTFEWTRQSLRSSFSQPHSLYEIPAALKHQESSSTDVTPGAYQEQPALKGFFSPPAQGTHHRQIYHFSVGPWRFAELIWPNLYGKMYPVHRRWINQLPAEGGVWSATLYLGWLPLLLACAGWSLRSSDPVIRWLSYLAMLAMLASLGWFGLGWLLNETQSFISGNQSSSSRLGHPVGGLYWLLVQLLPGYVQFRYPAKWFMIASLALSLLAARQFDTVRQRPVAGRLRCLMATTTIVSGLGIILVLLLRAPLEQQLSQAPSHAYWGPLDTSLAIWDILQALCQTALISLGCWWLFRRPRFSQHRWLAPMLVCLTALELTLANGWLVVSAADKYWQRSAADNLQTVESRPFHHPPLRIFRPRSHRMIPPQWRTRSSRLRHEEIVDWDCNTLLPRYHLLFAHGLVESPGSIQSRDYHMVWEVARSHNQATLENSPHPSILRLLGVGYRVNPRFQESTEATSAAGEERVPVGVSLQRLEGTFPRVWISPEVVSLAPLHSPTRDALRRRTEAVFFPGGEIRDFRRTAVIEHDSEPTTVDIPRTLRSSSSESCRIIRYEPQRVVIEAQLSEPGILVLSDRYDKNWHATVSAKRQDRYDDPQPCQVYRTNRIMRGIYLPAGDYQVVYQYRPIAFWLGSAVSIVTWLGLVCGTLVVLKRSLRTKR